MTENPRKRKKSECSVCCEEYTKSIRKPVECASCNYSACVACYKKYLVDKLDMECMQCKHAFDREFLHGNFTKVWIKGDYTRHREEILVGVELARMPTSQHLVTNFRLAQGLRETMDAETNEREVLRARLREIEVNKWNQTARLGRIRASRYNSDGLLGNGSTDAAARTFNRACPVQDCRGFLSQALKCGVCETFACKDCLGVVGETRDAEHTCDPAVVETVRYLRSETRPCPKCSIAISKVDGCDQMFCVYCQTAFSWRTGQVVTNGRIHNPEYFRWLREHSDGEIPRNAGEAVRGVLGGAVCGGIEIPYNAINRRLRSSDAPEDQQRTVMNAFQKLRHIMYADLPRLADPTALPDHSDLRLRYLMGPGPSPVGSITRDELKKVLAQREKRRDKEIAIRQCYDMLVSVSNEYLAEFVNDERQTATWLLTRLREICKFVNGSLDTVCNRFDCQCTRAPWIPDQTQPDPIMA